MPVMLRTNFSRHNANWVPALVAGSWGLVLAALVAAALLFDQHAQLENAMPHLRAQLKKLQSHHAHLEKDKVQLPPHAKLVALQARVSVINGIVASKGRPISELLSRLESLLPKQAWLTSLHHRRGRGELELVAAAHDVGALTKFLKRLEGDPYFSQALLTRQSHAKGKDKSVVEFDIRLVERR
ncbi:MAG TPA: PilN domain-containing protein [Gammaproteobacteria bacterium]|nr:PilN domain-containing protein [Gammaproteobacteria bacterium]